jgi:hypothetical protein
LKFRLGSPEKFLAAMGHVCHFSRMLWKLDIETGEDSRKVLVISEESGRVICGLKAATTQKGLEIQWDDACKILAVPQMILVLQCCLDVFTTQDFPHMKEMVSRVLDDAHCVKETKTAREVRTQTKEPSLGQG